ncbi:MAG TPA: SET domain-containing protein-lysine N-methyltransferase [Bacteroidia bacterium]|nr:SET domain-containing protein-lysine N-methyltransferase [Bacteroidia bacterium]
MALIVKKSQIPGSGKGLYTTKPLKKETKIIEYRGEVIGWKDYKERVDRDEDGYLFYFNKKRCVDAFHTPQYKARYANDANGFTRVKGLKNNSQYEIFGDKCFIVSTRDIKAGEEIFTDYTKDYWDSMKYNYNLKKKQKKEADKKQKIKKRY